MSGANVGSACAVVAGSFGFVRLRNSRLASVRGRPASAPLGISAGAVIAGSFGFVRLRDSRLASVRVRPASLRSGGFLLLAQEKVTKEKGTLTALVPRASCARDCAGALRGLPTAHPCTNGKLGAIPRAAPAGFSCARLPRPKGVENPRRGHPARTREMSDPVLRTLIRPTPCRAGGSAQAPQVRNRQSSSIEALHGFCSASRARTHCCSGFVAQERAASIPLQRRRAMADWPAGCARWSARIAPSAQGGAVGATGQRLRTLRARGAQGGAAGGVLSWGYPSLDKQRRVSGPQGCGTNRHGRQSVFAKANTIRTAQEFSASHNVQPQGGGTNAHGRESVFAKPRTTRQTRNFGASRKSQPQGYGTNSYARESAFANAITARQEPKRGASRTTPPPCECAR